MKVAIIGATGFVGSSILEELKNRNHEVTAFARNPKTDQNVNWIESDIFETEQLAKKLEGHDVIISAYNPGWTNPNIYDDFIAGSKSILEAVKNSGVKRYITIGGAGSLYVAPGIQAVDTPDFPKEYHAAASAARDFLNYIKEEKELDWALFSPAFEMLPTTTTGRTGNYRLGLEEPVFNEDQRSILSVEDLAVVIADEIENPKHHQVRFTAAY
jgi:uncharacterized protein